MSGRVNGDRCALGDTMPIPRSSLLAFAVALAGLVASLVPPGSALATDFAVTRQDDPAPDGCAVGDCSLREAIIAANAASDADTIILPAGTYTMTIAGPGEQAAATGDLDITNPVTITGAGAATTIVEAGPSSALGVDRVFDVRAGSLTISGLTVQHGNSSAVAGGGGIAVLTGASLTVTNCTITLNQAGTNGGGIANSGTLTMSNSTVSSNVTATGGTADQLGGGIASFNTGSMALTNVTVSGNIAGRQGGGVWNSGLGSTITGGLVTGNSTPTGTTVGTRDGGGVYNSSGGTLTISGASITNNTAGRDGGGVINSGTLTINNGTTISGNSTSVPDLMDPNVNDHNGGGIRNFSNGILTINGSTISNNSANRGGGGMAISGQADVTNATISANQSGTSGAGVAVFASATATTKLVMTGGTVTQNVSNASGGGIAGSGLLQITNTTISNNQATGGAGVAGFLSTVDNVTTRLELTGVTIRQNTATSFSGGGVSAFGADLAISGSTIENNSTVSDGAGVATGSSTSGSFSHTSQSSIVNSQIRANHGTTSNSDGGGISNSAGPMELRDSIVENNDVLGFGGGIGNFGGGVLTVSNTAIRTNSATGGGGGITQNNLASTSVTLTDTTVSGNTTSGGNGGGLIAGTGTVTVLRSTFTGNSAATGGGGILISAPVTLNVTNSTLSGNTTPQNGGGIHSSGTSSVVNVTFNANQASGGGAIRVFAGSTTVKNSVMANSTGGNCLGTVTSQGNNLEFPGSSCGLNPGLNDLPNVDPLLGPLANNGGATLTHALNGNSPAVDAANNSGCPATDQRNQARPNDGNGDGTAACDIGAIEAAVVTLTVTKSGAGSGTGTVTVAGSGINCGPACQRTYAVGRNVSLTATPAGATFTGWSGACAGTGACPLVMDAAKAVTASFQRENVFVSVGRTQSGGPALTATLGARPTCGPIVQIQFGSVGVPFGNAIVSITSPAGGPRNQTSGFIYTPPAGTTAVSLLIQRAVQSGGVIINIGVVDGCGTWPTFVGGGPSAFQ